MDDFTVELDISKDDYADFLDNQYKPHVAQHKKDGIAPISPAMYLKSYLKRKVEEILGQFFRQQ
mgnify:CR=1 FL=1